MGSCATSAARYCVARSSRHARSQSIAIGPVADAFGVNAPPRTKMAKPHTAHIAIRFLFIGAFPPSIRVRLPPTVAEDSAPAAMRQLMPRQPSPASGLRWGTTPRETRRLTHRPLPPRPLLSLPPCLFASVPLSLCGSVASVCVTLSRDESLFFTCARGNVGTASRASLQSSKMGGDSV